MITVTVLVGWTSHRPVRPDEHVSAVTVAVPFTSTLAAAELEASLIAVAMVICRPPCEMPTSTTISTMIC